MNLKKIPSIYLKKMGVTIMTCFCAGQLLAQAPVLPLMPDNYWYSSAGPGAPVIGLNASMIAYGLPYSPQTIFASAYCDGTAAPTMLQVVDPNWPGASVSIPVGSTVASVPDVIIGNNSGAPTTDYIIAVTYITLGGNIEIDYFDLTDIPYSTFSISPISYTTPFTGYNPQTVHLDVIAQSANTGPTNFAFCDYFAITFDDNSGPVSNVWVAAGTLNTQSIVAGPALVYTGGQTNGLAPDVAGVQRSGLLGPDNVADIVYLDANDNTLYFTEWDITTLTFTPTIVLDNGSTSYNIQKPRIDSRDDYVSYNPMYSNYKVVAQAYNSLTNQYEVRTYDNILGALTHWTSSNVINLLPFPGYPGPHTYNDYSPTVAMAGYQTFLISHFLEFPMLNDALMMEPMIINLSTGLFPTVPPHYYWVNNVSTGPLTPPPGIDAYDCNYANAVACPPNLGFVASVYVWAQYDASIPAYDIYYKYTTTGPGYFNFRESNPASVANVTTQDWKVYPNPATNTIFLNTGTNMEVNGYNILDMSGRRLATGLIQGTLTTIPTASLVPGTYVIQVNKDNSTIGQTMFVKD